MSSPSRIYTIIDQSLSIKILFKQKRVEGVTSVRMKMMRGCLLGQRLQANLCAKQMEITSVEVSSLQLYHPETKDIIEIDPKNYISNFWYPSPKKQLEVIQKNASLVQPSTFAMRKFSQEITQNENQ